MNNIRKLREACGLSQDQLATRIGITQSAISQWEVGATFPSTQNCIEMAAIFGCSIDELLGIDRAKEDKHGKQ